MYMNHNTSIHTATNPITSDLNTIPETSQPAPSPAMLPHPQPYQPMYPSWEILISKPTPPPQTSTATSRPAASHNQPISTSLSQVSTPTQQAQTPPSPPEKWRIFMTTLSYGLTRA
ncbi:hypothetical protein WAI453_013458 [Rhynchosporium graminicola]